MTNKYNLNQFIFTIEDGILRNAKIVGISEQKNYISKIDEPDQVSYEYLILRLSQGIVTKTTKSHSFGAYTEKISEYDLERKWFYDVEKYSESLKQECNNILQKIEN